MWQTDDLFRVHPASCPKTASKGLSAPSDPEKDNRKRMDRTQSKLLYSAVVSGSSKSSRVRRLDKETKDFIYLKPTKNEEIQRKPTCPTFTIFNICGSTWSWQRKICLKIQHGHITWSVCIRRFKDLLPGEDVICSFCFWTRKLSDSWSWSCIMYKLPVKKTSIYSELDVRIYKIVLCSDAQMKPHEALKVQHIPHNSCHFLHSFIVVHNL